MAETVNNMSAKRKLVMIGQAGDHSDVLIEGLVKSALKANPDMLIICKLENVLRGREIGEIPSLIHQLALKHGLNEKQISHAKDSIEGTTMALDWARTDDLLLLLGLDKRQEITDILNQAK